ncbi:DUF6104 family protein [Leekyejoonella antrihumi]|uniref:DUF6104 family protein n=1 Tax=Leekyejoonella antrihumi TaxID=1660198 RepID=UPI003CCC4A96
MDHQASHRVVASRPHVATIGLPRVFHRPSIEDLASRRGEEEVSLDRLAGRPRTFTDLNPEFDTPVDRLATWLARPDDDE